MNTNRPRNHSVCVGGLLG